MLFRSKNSAKCRSNSSWQIHSRDILCPGPDRIPVGDRSLLELNILQSEDKKPSLIKSRAGLYVHHYSECAVRFLGCSVKMFHVRKIAATAANWIMFVNPAEQAQMVGSTTSTCHS